MKNGIKLLAFDLDGTAIIMHKSLPEENRRALEYAAEKGIILVPATGRLRSFLPKEITDIGDIKYAICANGGSVNDIRSGDIICSAGIENSKALEIQKILDDYDIYIEYYTNDSAVTLTGNPEKAINDKEFPRSKHHFLTKKYEFVDNFTEFLKSGDIRPEKINLPYLTPQVRTQLWEKLSAIEGLKLTSSISDNLEINCTSATKGQALKALCKYLGITTDMCMTIGDNGNDADMLSAAKYSVAMGNSSQEAFDSAKYTTDSCDDMGFAKAIYRFI